MSLELRARTRAHVEAGILARSHCAGDNPAAVVC